MSTGVSRIILTQSLMYKQGQGLNYCVLEGCRLYHYLCYTMRADGAIKFIDHNFLWVIPIIAWAYLRN